ncbi:hypothetical protein DOK67_0000797 [Enterococcus sp. DIV0212c]
MNVENIQGKNEQLKGNLSDIKGYITITKDNFLDYFQLNGSATYDQNSGYLTVTPDVQYQVGSATFNKKIKFDQDINIDVDVNIGNKSQAQGGADGMGIGFHDDSITSIGGAGNGFGLGGLNGSLGFKLDTYYNSVYGTVGKADADPVRFKNKSFGAFIIGKSDAAKSIQTVDNKDIYGPFSSPQEIVAPANNTFKNLLVNYSYSSKLFSSQYNDSDVFKIWSIDMNGLINTDAPSAKSLILSGSTGGQKNLQQFKINEITFAVPVAMIEKVDEDDNNIKLPDAEFDIFTSNGIKVLANLKTDNDGIIYLPVNLENGNYYAKEVKSPQGYQEDHDTKYPFEVDGNKTENYFAATITNKKIPQKNADLNIKGEVISPNQDLVVPTTLATLLKNIPIDNTLDIKQTLSMIIPTCVADTNQSFKTVSLSLNEKKYSGYKVDLKIPAFYSYAGYQLTDSKTIHNSSNRKTEEIPIIDFNKNLKYWLTVYIEPKLLTDGPPFYNWDYKLNDFGKISIK